MIDQIDRAASQADTSRAEGIALGLAMAAGKYAKHGAIALAECVETNVSWRHEIYRSILALAPIPPHVAAARVLLDDLRLVTAMVDWADANAFRLSQVQGFGYGNDRLLLTARDCWLRYNQVFWQRQSAPETKGADHGEMMRQMEIYRVSLTMRAALEQIAKDGE